MAKLLEQKLGGEMFMMPKVNSPEGVDTPDYIFRGSRYDLKTITKPGKDALYNAIHKKRKQATNFVFDYSESGMTQGEVFRQAEAIFRRTYVSFVDRIIIVKNWNIERILDRNK